MHIDKFLMGGSRFCYAPDDGDAGGGAGAGAGGGGDAGADKGAGAGADAGAGAGGDNGQSGQGDNGKKAGDNQGGQDGAGAGGGDGVDAAGKKKDAGAGKDGGAGADKGAGKDGKDKGEEERKGVWSDNWREDYAGEDKKLLARLQRYDSPKAALDALIAAQDRIRSGELSKPPGKDATPEEVKEYRERMGIPESPEGYDLNNLGENIVIGDDDKEAVGVFLKEMHGLNASPEVVRAAIATKYKIDAMATAAILENDEKLAEQCVNVLRAEYGADFKKNDTVLRDFINKHVPEDIREDLKGGRLGDGTPLFSSPAFVKFMTQTARELYPAGTVGPGAGMDNIDTIENELNDIRKFMKTNRTEYYKDEKKQARFRELLEAEARFKGKK